MNSSLSPFSVYTEALWRLLYPAACALCSDSLELEERGLCHPCLTLLHDSKLSFPEQAFEPEQAYLNTVWSLFPYENPFNEFLTALKFEKKRWLLSCIRKSFEELGQSCFAETHFDYIVPVPPDLFRLAEREFHLPNLLSGILAKSFQTPVLQALKKQPGITPQNRLNRMERLINPFGMFKVINQAPLAGRRVLLVDDIYTTGATAAEAARVLNEAGAKRIDAITLARTL